MARKLKTFVTTSGFFELAVAAPSQKAASQLFGIKDTAFSQGFAYETEDEAIIAATMDKAGAVLRRAVGSKGTFSEMAALPKLSALQDAIKNRRRADALRAPPTTKNSTSAKATTPNNATKRQAAELYDLAEKRREREEQLAEAQLAKKRERQEAARRRAQEVLDEARSGHENRATDIQKQRDVLERKARTEDARWSEEERRLKSALQHAGAN